MNNSQLLAVILTVMVGFPTPGLQLSATARGSTTVQADSSKSLETLVETPGISNANLFVLFSNILSSAHLPGGIVSVTECSNESHGNKYFFPAFTGPLRDALNSVIALDKHYRWEEQGNAINLLPTGREPDFLNASLGEFNLDDTQATVIDATSKLLLDPGVQHIQAQLGLKKDDLEQYVGGVSPGREMKIQLKNVNLHQALNAIAIAHGHAVWLYSESHCGRSSIFTITWISR